MDKTKLEEKLETLRQKTYAAGRLDALFEASRVALDCGSAGIARAILELVKKEINEPK